MPTQNKESSAKSQTTNEDTPPAQYADLLTHLIGVARDAVQQGDELLSVAFLLKDGQVGDMVASAFEDDRVKDGFAETVRQRASKIKPDAIVMVAEAWSLPKEYTTPERLAKFNAQYKRIADAPYKVDIVMVKMETDEGEWLGRAEMHKVTSGRTFGEITWLKADYAQGRFMGLLPVTYATPQQINAYLALLRRKLDASVIDSDYRMTQGELFMQVVEKIIRQMPAKLLTEEALDALIKGAMAAWTH